MGIFARLLGLGNGKLKPELRTALEAEGLVLIEEGLSGSLRYYRFRAPGRYFNGKITPECIGLGISKERVVAYCRSGRAKLMNSPFTNPNLQPAEISASDGRLEILIDYDRLQVPKTSGQVCIRMNTPNAQAIRAELEARIPRVNHSEPAKP